MKPRMCFKALFILLMFLNSLSIYADAVPLTPANKSATQTQPNPDQADAEELLFWDSVRDSPLLEDYQAFLKAYPNGKYAELAKETLLWEKIKTSKNWQDFYNFIQQFPKSRYAETAKEKVETLLWESIKNSDKKQDYENFLLQFPQSKNTQAAKHRLHDMVTIDQRLIMVKLPSGLFIGKYEVSQGFWQAVMGNNPSYFKSCGDDCPVEQVSWDDVQQFIVKLNKITGRHYRLPTEEEWSAACLGGEKTEYCGSNSVDAVAWYSGNSGDKTHSIGQKKPNHYGLYDMSGNVWEWTSSCWESDCSRRVGRGGSWSDNPASVRSAYRYWYYTADRNFNLGFRLAQDP